MASEILETNSDMLELTAIPECTPSMHSNIPPVDRYQFGAVSDRVFKALVGSVSIDKPHKVIVRNSISGTSVICTLYSFSSSLLVSEQYSIRSAIALCPISFSSLELNGVPDAKVIVSVLKNNLPRVLSITVSQASYGIKYSDEVIASSIDRLLQESPRDWSCGELIAVPVWSFASKKEHVTGVSPMDAPPESWVGPGRILNNTQDVLLLEVKHLESDNNHSVNHGTVDGGTRILLGLHSHKFRTIPGIRRFLFPSINTEPPYQPLLEWTQSNSQCGLLVGHQSLSKLALDLDSSHLFTHIINCEVRQPGDVIDAISDFLKYGNTPSLVVLWRIDTHGRLEQDVTSFIKDSVLKFPRIKFLVVVDRYESLTAHCSHMFDTILDMRQVVDKGSIAGDGPNIDAYETILSKADNIPLSRISDELRNRYMKSSSLSEAVVETKVNVLWDQIGGLDNAKKELRDLMRSKLRRGILLFGPPGTGKTMLAKAVATELANHDNNNHQHHESLFISVKGPEILSMYIGESEKNIREIFQRARLASTGSANCSVVIFFDELDSIAPSRGVSRDSANVMDRVVATLLTEIDNLPESVLLIGATNRPDLLDPSLLRPGRIDRQVFVGIPKDKSSLVEAVAIKTYKLDWNPDQIKRVAKLFPKTMTGSDVAAVFGKAYGISAKCVVEKIRRVSHATGIDVKQLVASLSIVVDGLIHQKCKHEVQDKVSDHVLKCVECEEILVDQDVTRPRIDEQVIKEALKYVVPSVSESELASYNDLRDRRATVIS